MKINIFQMKRQYPCYDCKYLIEKSSNFNPLGKCFFCSLFNIWVCIEDYHKLDGVDLKKLFPDCNDWYEDEIIKYTISYNIELCPKSKQILLLETLNKL